MKIFYNALLLCIILMTNQNYAYSISHDYVEEDVHIHKDPFEHFNRSMFKINQGLYKVALRPIANLYSNTVPEWGQARISDFSSNLQTPVYAVNNFLQGNIKGGFVSIFRFLFNSTIGVLGFYDIAAAKFNMPAYERDFGTTLAVYGAGDGIYLFLPIIGPTNVRDATGLVMDVFVDPATYILSNGALIAKNGLTITVAYADNYPLIDNVQNSSLDPYSVFKTLYLQKRAKEIKRAKQQVGKM